MWTLISSINFRTTRRRLARPIIAATVVVGTFTQVALALLPQPRAVPQEAGASTAAETWQVDVPTGSATDASRDIA